ncbi:MAG: hypothetical protein K2L96_01010, partial [Muribaculaceae bacterium]|nr:hypothetical protein [Muribaculaceae bacterium]
ISAMIFSSCEPEESFGFPSKIELSGSGECIEIYGKNDTPPGIIEIQVLDYNGDGNNSGLLSGEAEYIETTTEWLTVKYFFAEYKLALEAKPNDTGKNRKLYLYLLSGKSRQEITVSQSK